MQHWLKGSVKEIINETKSVKRFFIQINGETNFDFLPGQHIIVDQSLGDEDPYNSSRSYAIANKPGSNMLEIIVAQPKGDPEADWYWNSVKTGSEIKFHGPHGKFLLPAEIDRDIYMVCTGTGIAPYRSMLQHIRDNNVPHKNIYLLFGCRNFADALFYGELKSLEQQLEDFYYLPTFSRETANNHLLQRTGYVHSVYEEFMRRNMILNGVNGVPKIKPAYFYLCGWQQMIGDAKERILLYGYHASDIQLEIFG